MRCSSPSSAPPRRRIHRRSRRRCGARRPGLDRLAALARGWIDHLRDLPYRGGCFFASAGQEFSNKPGPVRDAIVAHTQAFIDQLEEQAQLARRLGEVDDAVDPERLAFQVHALAQSERTVDVDSLAELTFSINDVSDPIEVGGETIYEIRLTNSGSRNDTNVRVQLQLPGGMTLLGADGDAQEDGRGGVYFQPRNQLAANDEVIYRVRAQGVSPGTHLIKAIVTSDQSTTPVTKEESTMVYADR